MFCHRGPALSWSLGVPRMYCFGVQELPQGTGTVPVCPWVLAASPGPGYEVVSGVAALLTAASLSPCPWLQQKAVSPAWSRERGRTHPGPCNAGK